jgi:CheY-like chemotaxis protein/anti-sigma regulatory factor (Ser/Thr protein kinase)
MVRPLAMERAISLPDPARILCSQQVLADRLRIKQVLLNLLTNAIKYNCDGGRVSVDCRVDAAELVIEIGDQGRGLSDEQISRLFQPFERLDAERTGIEGTGIGLALSKRLVEMMDGRIGVNSEVGQGSRFWIRLPLAVHQTEPAALGPPSGLSTSDFAPDEPLHTVLYIEDNPVNTILMEAMLSRLRGVRLVTAVLPRAGLVLARNAHPALILLDINLPGMDGYEVLRHLQADRRTAGIPVVAVSANAMDADLQAGLAAGFADYLPKPLDMQNLLDTVRRLLGRHEDSRLSTVM